MMIYLEVPEQIILTVEREQIISTAELVLTRYLT